MDILFVLHPTIGFPKVAVIVLGFVSHKIECMFAVLKQAVLLRLFTFAATELQWKNTGVENEGCKKQIKTYSSKGNEYSFRILAMY